MQINHISTKQAYSRPMIKSRYGSLVEQCADLAIELISKLTLTEAANALQMHPAALQQILTKTYPVNNHLFLKLLEEVNHINRKPLRRIIDAISQ